MKNNSQGKRNDRGAEKLRSGRGMTMAELLIVVAIIVILAGVAFISLSAYQRLLEQRERDGYAKEIFIAAQNHLSMARSEGYYSILSDGTPDAAKVGSSEGANDVYYFVVHAGDKITDNNSSVLDMMLPFASIDDSVRKGGNYIIRYQLNTGRVLDVFYCSNGSRRFDHTLTAGDYTGADGAESIREYVDVTDDQGNVTTDRSRKRRTEFREGAILGWYGGTKALEVPTVRLKAPSIKVTNGDRLTVSVRDGSPNHVAVSSIKLIIEGEESKTKMALLVRNGATLGSRCTGLDGGSYNYEYVLDDISSSSLYHFANLSGNRVGDNGLIAGENIKIRAVAYGSNAFSNVVYSSEAVENSLYESIRNNKDEVKNAAGQVTQEATYTALVGSIRHLENLDRSISRSGQDISTNSSSARTKMTFKAAEQTKDLVLLGTNGTGFSYSTDGKRIYTYNDTAGGTHYYRPVTIASAATDNKIDYNGLRHSISGVETTFAGNAGLFGTLNGGSIKNLELKDFDITSSGADAGALAGSLSGVRVSNVVVYRTSDNIDSDSDTDKTTPQIQASNGDAGGLVGHFSSGVIRYSGAAFVVNGQNAGGLIGSAGSGTTVRACFSGGRTDRGEYYTHNSNGTRNTALYNVRGSVAAGGLIGDAGSAAVNYSYSTCSAGAWTSLANGPAGGLAGKVSGASIIGCYSTGMTNGDYAFIGSTGEGGVSGSGNRYYEAVNPKDDEYKSAMLNASENFVKALDENKDSFGQNSTADWSNNGAYYYDPYMETAYNGIYAFRTVTEMKGTSSDDLIFAHRHHGDWPSPEAIYINF